MFAVINDFYKSECRQEWGAIGMCSQFVADAVKSFKIQNKYKNFTSLRNQLSHGNALPGDDSVAAELVANTNFVLLEVKRSIINNLGDAFFSNDNNLLYLIFGENKIDITGMWKIFQGDDVPAIYSHASPSKISYFSYQFGIKEETNYSAVKYFLRKYGVFAPGGGCDLGESVKNVLKDISAFTEDSSVPSYYFGDDEYNGCWFVTWTLPISSGDDPRIDIFRVGRDDRKEWKSGKNKKGEWAAYSDFLKDVTHWPILSRRIMIGLEQFSKEKINEESSRLGIEPTSLRGPANVREFDDKPSDINNGGARGEIFKLGARIDESCENLKLTTCVYFLVGQAGLGKTELMLSLAKERAKDIANNVNLNKPLYLFVSSTGRTLASLEDAVNGTLNITKLLSSNGAKALCRNGLLVLLVDGFDELLGSSSYENALGSLEPWFKELGGRGVLVASARSSYYLTQYRRSLAETKDINVDHTLLELQPWTKEETLKYLNDSGVSACYLDKLKEKDWNILSVPFFSKAYSAWCGVNPERNQSIFEIVATQYLERESMKLVDVNKNKLMSTEELQGLFVEIAEVMQLQNVRQIDSSTLNSCAQLAIGADSIDAVKPGLSQRLSSLCGLGVNVDGGKSSQFSFSHDVMFDCFLSFALQKNVERGFSSEYFLSVLEKSKVNPEVFDWLLEMKSGTDQTISNGIKFVSAKEESVLSENLGTLWGIITNRNVGVPASDYVENLRLGAVMLKIPQGKVLTIKNGKIESLDVLLDSRGKISLCGSEVEFFKCDAGVAKHGNVLGIDSCKILSIQMAGKFSDKPSDINRILADCGLLVIENDNSSSKREAVTYFLERAKAKPEVQIVVGRDDLISDDPRLSWTRSYGDYMWRNFLQFLENYGIATLEKITTAGKPKSRLIFNVLPINVLRQNKNDQEVVDFWSAVDGN